MAAKQPFPGIKSLLTTVLFLLTPLLYAQEPEITIEKTPFTFTWDLDADHARVLNGGTQVWAGSLLPSFWLQTGNDSARFIHASFDRLENEKVFFTLSDAGQGSFSFAPDGDVIRMQELEVQWTVPDTRIISLNFGLVELTRESSQVVPSLEEPCWPDWHAAGYCVPTAKGAPIQSFFRFWQFGSASIPLGNFGSSLGTPYAAAFPRPYYAMAMGGPKGWACFGAGEIPDGAMVLKLKTASASLQFLYREDLWGAPEGLTRRWGAPLVIAMEEEAYDAYRTLFASLGSSAPVDPSHQENHWNTWGDFRQERYDMDKILIKANKFEAEVLTWDMMWETFESSGIPDYDRFPGFHNELRKISSSGLKTGFWQSVTWVEDYEAAGLTPDDLVCGADGRPRKVNWVNSPYNNNKGYYALDPSSERAVYFLQERTKTIVQEFGADLLKLDFAYNIPSPDVGAPRNPELRGERYAYALLKIIADAAREVNPDITLQYYGISPLMHDCYNLIAMDDMGDAGNKEKEGHGQWSIWASLAGIQGRAIMASSGYDWDADQEVLMNTAIVGSPGLVLPGEYRGGSIPKYMVAKRIALARWYRRTTGWEPLWLNSAKGSLSAEPAPACWGRMEDPGDILPVNDSPGSEKTILTALALRQDNIENLNRREIRNIRFTGEWALISQDHHSIYETDELAAICFEDGTLRIPLPSKPAKIVQVFENYEREYTGWSYESGVLELINDAQFKEKAQVGFLVIRE